MSLLTHKASIKYDATAIGMRELISQIENIGFSAKFVPKSEKSDLREILKRAVDSYRLNMLFAIVISTPLEFLIWMVPQTNPEFVTGNT